MFQVFEEVLSDPAFDQSCSSIGIAATFNSQSDAQAWIKYRQRLFLNRGHDPVAGSWWAATRFLDDNIYRWTVRVSEPPAALAPAWLKLMTAH